jgi:glycosyltransferase involved in cell wall biosynthesis
MLPVTVWMNMPSFYQADLFRALVASRAVDLQVIFARTLSPDRTHLGWQADLEGFPYRFLRSPGAVADAFRLARSQRDRVHVVNGIWAEPSFAAALLAMAWTRSRYAIYSEAPDPDPIRSPVKTHLQQIYGQWIVERAMGVLPISSLASRFFGRLSAADGALYPFGYFRSAARDAQERDAAPDRAEIEVLFVGQLTPRKRLDLLLEAIAPLCKEYPRLVLTVIGSGEELPALQDRVGRLGMAGRVRFEGALPSEAVPARMAAADVLVLPSRWDGWGLVVNEALSAGVPVIVSDCCGAADLVQDGVNGYVFRGGDVADLRARLRSFLERRAEWSGFRAHAAALGRALSAEAAAAYLVRCLQHMMGLLAQRPAPPWMPCQLSGSSDCSNPVGQNENLLHRRRPQPDCPELDPLLHGVGQRSAPDLPL